MLYGDGREPRDAREPGAGYHAVDRCDHCGEYPDACDCEVEHGLGEDGGEEVVPGG